MSNLRKEEYVPAGAMVLESFKRDQADFLMYYKKMDDKYLESFTNSVDRLKKLESTYAMTEEQKGITKKLYAMCDELADSIQFMKNYAKAAGLNTVEINKAAQYFRDRNVEGGVQSGRDAMVYYKANETALLSGNMPDDYMDTFGAKLDQAESLNNEQNDMLRTRPEKVAENNKFYDEVHRYITEVCSAGRLIYKNDSLKRKEYTMTNIVALLRSPRS